MVMQSGKMETSFVASESLLEQPIAGGSVSGI